MKFANIVGGALRMGRSAAGRFIFIAAVAGLALVGKAPVADGFPSKPVRIIVPYTPGSPNDVLARLLAQHLQAKLAQAALIANKPAGGPTIGSKPAAASPPTAST